MTFILPSRARRHLRKHGIQTTDAEIHWYIYQVEAFAANLIRKSDQVRIERNDAVLDVEHLEEAMRRLGAEGAV